ncbi:hypothetical protein K438DRAFT_1969568 [Mycena galopus ATCC 62051]|nr:hypothetical protein K438DRAFT_1969568 [Mycena galopus ATCC 62051]
MASRARLYQTRLDGFLRAKPEPNLPQSSTPGGYLKFEGEAWFPIDVESGSSDAPIDVEWRDMLTANESTWTKEKHAASLGATAGTRHGHNAGVDAQVFRCGICYGTLASPVIPLCMHVFCYGCLHRWLMRRVKTCPVCRATVNTAPIRDAAFERELADAVKDGIVDGAEADAEPTYKWEDVTF